MLDTPTLEPILHLSGFEVGGTIRGDGLRDSPAHAVLPEDLNDVGRGVTGWGRHLEISVLIKSFYRSCTYHFVGPQDKMFCNLDRSSGKNGERKHFAVSSGRQNHTI